MSSVVPADDLPGSLVPSADLPGTSAAPAPAAAPVDRGITAGDVARTAGKVFSNSIMVKPGLMASDALDKVAYKGGEKVSDAATAIGLPPPAAAGLGLATNVGIQAVPTILGGEAGKLTSPAFRSGARELMQSALKPSKAELKSGKAAEAVETMLQRGANVTEGGVEKLTKYIDELDDQLERVISQAKGDVSKIEVLKPIKQALAKFREKANPNEDLATIRKAAKEFFDHPALRGSDAIPVEKAQAMKRATYKGLGDKAYGMGLKPEAERDAQKALAEGLRQGVAKAAPGAEEINAEMGPLINARNMAQDRVLMSGNKNPLGLGIIAHPSMWIPWMADRSELAKSLAARAMNAGAERVPQAAGNVVGGAAGYESGRRPKEQTP